MPRKSTLYALAFAIIAIGAALFSYYVRVDTIRSTYTDEMRVIRELEWEMVRSVLNENYDKAEIMSDRVRERIVRDVQAAYAGRPQDLERDLDYPDASKPLYQIIHAGISGVFINRESDANDPFVFTSKGIIGDLSLDCSPGSADVAFRSWEQEYAQTYNKDLAKAAVFSMLTKAPVRVFWEFSKPADPEKHAYISPMTLDALRSVFLNEGLEGLRTYEFISYTTIFNESDFVGRQTRTGMGIRNSDARIIYVAQGFNLLDAIDRNHSGTRGKVQELKKFVDAEAAVELKESTISLVGVLIVILASIAGIHVSRLINEKG